MTENMKKFVEQANQNASLKTELEALSKEYEDSEAFEQNKAVINQKTAEIAARHGFTLMGADFAAEKTELSETELEAVAGGNNDGLCICGVLGGGVNLGGYNKGWCACTIYGTGWRGDYVDECCWCVVGGYGAK